VLEWDYAELPRMPKRRSSQNFSYVKSGSKSNNKKGRSQDTPAPQRTAGRLSTASHRLVAVYPRHCGSPNLMNSS
jgi:hypothetical protein